ncbi:hypothetical protein HG531_000029 [Fusarium graminearum]|nr:hypothetical protein HG531_000029 [Fusarium graminearum]
MRCRTVSSNSRLDDVGGDMAWARRQDIGQVTRASQLAMSSEGLVFRQGEQQLENITVLLELPFYVGHMVDAVDTGGAPSLTL